MIGSLGVEAILNHPDFQEAKVALAWQLLDKEQPPPYDVVLLYVPGVDPSMAAYEYSLKIARLGYGPGTGMEWDERATHWMPLPPPPPPHKRETG
jgi:hypothetical protein